MTNPHYEYDVALSFAREQRDYVEKVADALRRQGGRVFYDFDQQAELLGKDLYVQLQDIYWRRARLCVIFISKAYRERLWTKHELRSAQARAFEESHEYIVPVRFDNTQIPGILPTVGYIDAGKVSPEELAEMIIRKLADPAIEARDPSRPPSSSSRRSVRKNLERGEWVLVSVVVAALGAVASLQSILGVFTSKQPTGLALALTVAVVGAIVLALAGVLWQRFVSVAPSARSVILPVLISLLVGVGGGYLGGTLIDARRPTYAEQAYNHRGTPLYSDPGVHPVGDGQRIPFGTAVEVLCKVKDATGMESVTAWYLIHSGPYEGLYAPSDTFLNGDSGPSGTTAVDPQVPDC